MGDRRGVAELQLSFGTMLRKLAQRSSVLAGAPMALVRGGELRGTVVRADFDRARRLGLVETLADRDAWRLSDKGREAVRRLTCGGDGATANGHGETGTQPR